MVMVFNLIICVKCWFLIGFEFVVDGVWVVCGGFFKIMNVYFLCDGDGVMFFDVGIKVMIGVVVVVGVLLGGIMWVVLGYGYLDYCGVVFYFGVFVLCYVDNCEDVEGDGGMCYFDFFRFRLYVKVVFFYLLRIWDGGFVEIVDMVVEGDELVGFEVVVLFGYVLGFIGLWCVVVCLVLVSDCFYMFDL